jgi:hypothetical protein
VLKALGVTQLDPQPHAGEKTLMLVTNRKNRPRNFNKLQPKK